MKRIIFIVITLLFFTTSFKLIASEKDNDRQWTKIAKNIYIDRSSIKKDIYSTSAWFLLKDKNKFNKINDIDVHYEIVKYEIECEIPITISIAHSKSYDKSNILLDEYVNEQGYACAYPCMSNDDIFVKELCK